MASATDGDVVKIARKIEDHMRAIETLIQQIEDMDHSKADRIAAALWAECHQPAWATHVVHSRLYDPSRWETGDFGIRHIAASKARKGKP